VPHLLIVGAADHHRRRHAARFVTRIIAGDSPGDLPIEDITVPALAINLKTAKALGIEVPSDILVRAEEVIEQRFLIGSAVRARTKGFILGARVRPGVT
jgi:hypothetical protein